MAQRFGGYGGILQNQLFLCGGFDSFYSESPQKCQIVLPKYKESFPLLEVRINASSVQISQDTLWITGGKGRHTEDPDKKTTELVSLNQPTIKGIELPFSIHSHSMVAVDQHTIYLIGGALDSIAASKKTWVIDPTNNFDLKPGPSLQVGRHKHSSSKITINGKIYLVVAGGMMKSWGGMLDSVELLDTKSPDQGWITGKTFKRI